MEQTGYTNFRAHFKTEEEFRHHTFADVLKHYDGKGNPSLPSGCRDTSHISYKLAVDRLLGGAECWVVDRSLHATVMREVMKLGYKGMSDALKAIKIPDGGLWFELVFDLHSFRNRLALMAVMGTPNCEDEIAVTGYHQQGQNIKALRAGMTIIPGKIRSHSEFIADLSAMPQLNRHQIEMRHRLRPNYWGGRGDPGLCQTEIEDITQPTMMLVGLMWLERKGRLVTKQIGSVKHIINIRKSNCGRERA